MTRWPGRLIALLCCLPALAVAEEYYWIAAKLPGARYSTPDAACAAVARTYEGGNSAWIYVSSRVELYKPDIFRCYGNFDRIHNQPPVLNQLLGSVHRYGDSCASGEYDEQTGVCKEPPKDCASTVGELFPARGPISPVIESGGRFYVAGPPASSITACYESCRYGDGARASSCYRVPKSDSQGFCNYVLKGNGESCSADAYDFATTGDPLNPGADPDDPSVPPSDPDDPGCPSGWVWSGTTCVKDPNANGGGEGEGEGSGNGESGGEGGTGGGGSGNGSGNGEDGEGDGSGEDGGGNGEGSGSGNGEGEGEGECDPAKDPSCDDIPGPSGSLDEPKPGSWAEANEEWDKKVEEAKQDLKDTVKAHAEDMKNAFSLQLAGGGGELPCESFSVWGETYRLCVADYAGQLSNLRLALLLMAALIAALIILKD